MQTFIVDQDFFLSTGFSAFLLLCPWLKQTYCQQEVSEIQSLRVITWLTVIDLIPSYIFQSLVFYDATFISCPILELFIMKGDSF